MPKYWFDHVHLTSPDALKTAEFYQTMFGAKRVSVVEAARGGIRVELNLNGTTILITQRPPRPESSPGTEADYGLIHFGFRTDNLEAAVEELKAKGVEFRDDGIREVSPGLRISFFWAPENVAVELQE